MDGSPMPRAEQNSWLVVVVASCSFLYFGFIHFVWCWAVVLPSVPPACFGGRPKCFGGRQKIRFNLADFF